MGSLLSGAVHGTRQQPALRAANNEEIHRGYTYLTKRMNMLPAGVEALGIIAV
jgi:hypothetical protein